MKKILNFLGCILLINCLNTILCTGAGQNEITAINLKRTKHRNRIVAKGSISGIDDYYDESEQESESFNFYDKEKNNFEKEFNTKQLSVSKDAIFEQGETRDFLQFLKRINYDHRQCPYNEGEPVFVDVSVVVSNIRAVSEVTMDYALELFYREAWFDKRLDFDKTIFNNKTELALHESYTNFLWHPDTFMPNAIASKNPQKQSISHRSLLRLNEKGEVLYSRRISIVAECPMDLTLFPFDSQICKLGIESYGYTADQVRYRWSTGQREALKLAKIRLPDFQIKEAYVTSQLESYATGDYSRLYVCFIFTRSSGFCFLQLIIPSTAVVITSWVSLWMESETEFQDMISIILAITFLIFSYNEMMPRVSYIKAMDVYLGVCFMIVFFSLIKLAFVKYLRQKLDKKHTKSVFHNMLPLVQKSSVENRIIENQFNNNSELPRNESINYQTITMPITINNNVSQVDTYVEFFGNRNRYKFFGKFIPHITFNERSVKRFHFVSQMVFFVGFGQFMLRLLNLLSLTDGLILTMRTNKLKIKKISQALKIENDMEEEDDDYYFDDRNIIYYGQSLRFLNFLHKIRYDHREFPRNNSNSEPVTVYVSVVVNNVRSVSEVTMDYSLELIYREMWTDPRLAFNEKDFQNKKILELHESYVDDIWHADTFFPNSIQSKNPKERSISHRSLLRLRNDGFVLYSRRISVVAECLMDLTLFPFDSQLCKLDIESYGHTIDLLQYNWSRHNERNALKLENIKLPDFQIIEAYVTKKNETYATGTYSRLYICFIFKRSIGYCFLQLIIPSTAIVITSWVSLWMDNQTSFHDMISIILAITFLLFSYNEVMPRVSYIKAMDVYLGVCFCIVFLSLIKLAILRFMRERTYIPSEKFNFLPKFCNMIMATTNAASIMEKNKSKISNIEEGIINDKEEIVDGCKVTLNTLLKGGSLSNTQFPKFENSKNSNFFHITFKKRTIRIFHCLTQLGFLIGFILFLIFYFAIYPYMHPLKIDSSCQKEDAEFYAKIDF
uniref:Uncharacterized protein n=1 Tax=Strongyloides stercoralis TaxID=6248 RepID=A0AAF5DMB1_STRER